MMKFNSTAVATTVSALALVGFVSAQLPASAQEATSIQKRYNTRPLTVKKRMVAAPAAPAPAPVGPFGAAGAVVAAPFTVLNTIFPVPGARVGGVTAVRYANAGAEQAKIDEGFATPVPVDRSGPIFVVQNGDPTVSPLTFIGAPIAAVGTLTQVPFHILGAATAPVL